MREAVRRYGSRAVGALRPLTARARSLAERLGARALAVVRGGWRDRARLLDQGDAWVRRHKVAVSVAFVAIAIVWLIGLIVFSLPDRVLSWRFWTRRPEDVRNLSLVVIGILGIGAGIFGLLFGAVRAYAAHVQARAANEQARVAEQGHITDRFTKAIEQLGSDKLEVRLGAIYALERIARDSRRDHGPIMETLTAYVRENAPWPPRGDAEGLEDLLAAAVPADGGPSGGPTDENEPTPAGEKPARAPRTDIQAVLTVLGRRERRHDVEKGRLNLAGTDLRGANLVNSHFERANLSGTHLERAVLIGIHLEGANLGFARLERAALLGAHLEGVNLGGARLEGADLDGAHLEEVDFDGANLKRAYLIGARLERANLVGAQGLTQKQLDTAYGDAETKLPEGLTISLADDAAR